MRERPRKAYKLTLQLYRKVYAVSLIGNGWKATKKNSSTIGTRISAGISLGMPNLVTVTVIVTALPGVSGCITRGNAAWHRSTKQMLTIAIFAEVRGCN